MIEKTLKPATIIPPNLYVKRDADRQLHRVINEMGRPGYILVSRQMGKTNLLLNAKRELGNEKAMFLYIDLSNHFSTPRECFRNIIDTAINTYSDNLSSIHNDIVLNRKSNELSPHKEYELELLKILKCFDGKIVIILDEIDALTVSDYSDQFFAQVRSMYFSRINYPDFNRLTYVLSGVVEPSEIIKDKNKSPFNIGEKIYLDDFTNDEFSDFVLKTGLKLSTEVKERIFYWISGHPRMTWDVCSELENISLTNSQITADDVDTAIDKLYLKNYDLAPVDHIRTLVRKNTEIRRAVREINANISNLSDPIKKKLYLAGIIKSDLSAKVISIKNEVIKGCLTNDWLKSIDGLDVSLINLAEEQQNLGNYSEAIRLYNEFLRNTELLDAGVNLIYLSVGNCYLMTQEFEKALEYYGKCSFDKKSNAKEYYGVLLHSGISRHNLGDFDGAIGCYKQIISNSQPSLVKCKAFLNYAGAIINKNFDANKEDALKIYNNVLDEISKYNLTDLEKEINKVKLVTFYNIANVSTKMGNIENAKAAYVNAIETKDIKYKPFFYSCLYDLEGDFVAKHSIISKAVNLIIENKLVASDDEGDPITPGDVNLSLSSSALANLLVKAYEVHDNELYDRAIDYSLNNVFTNYRSKPELTYHISLYAKNSKKYRVAEEMLEGLVADNAVSQHVDNRLMIEVLRTLGIIKYYVKKAYFDYIQKYIELFDANQNFDKELTDDDFIAFAYGSIYLRKKRMFREALKIMLVLEKRFVHANKDSRSNFIVIYFFLSQLYDELKMRSNAIESANKTLELIKDHAPDKVTVIDVNQINDIKLQVKNIIESNSRVPIKLQTPKVGRNDLCPCGSGKKYKKCHGK